MAKKAQKEGKPAEGKIKLQPLGDRVVVEREESETMTAGGIVLPDTAKDKPTRGKVISVGDGRLLKRRHAGPAAGQGGRPRAVHLLCRRAVQAGRPRTAADARRGHPGGARTNWPLNRRQSTSQHDLGETLASTNKENNDSWPR